MEEEGNQKAYVGAAVEEKKKEVTMITFELSIKAMALVVCMYSLISTYAWQPEANSIAISYPVIPEFLKIFWIWVNVNLLKDFFGTK